MYLVRTEMPFPNLFIWWATAITFGVIFLVLVSVYLYVNRCKNREQCNYPTVEKYKLEKNFTFVWILLGLLILYITSISGGSYTLFAIGNIIVEGVLIVYIIRNRDDKSQSF